MVINDFIINKHIIKVSVYTGKVLSIKEWNEYIGNYSIRRKEVWILRDDNKEEFLKFSNLNVREGHFLTIICYEIKNKIKKLKIINNNTQEELYWGLDDNDKNIFYTPKLRLLNLVFVFCLVSALVACFHIKFILAGCLFFAGCYINKIKNKLLQKNIDEFSQFYQKILKEELNNISPN